jgi:aspartate/methionine/tyrosine aminotransferase
VVASEWDAGEPSVEGDPAVHHDGPTAGLPALRDMVARTRSASGAPTAVDQVQITLGAKHALFAAVSAVAGPGDEVMTIAPGWPGHQEVVGAARALPVEVTPSAADALRVTRRIRDFVVRADTPSVG